MNKKHAAAVGFALLSLTAAAQEISPTQLKPSLRESLRKQTIIKEVANPETPILEVLPADMLNSNLRFVTVSSENDFFASSTDKDYTNGIRFTFMNMGAEQPFFVDWIDDLSPTFDVNKTTTSYFSFGQNLYTPQNITSTELNPQDRPYAGFTYVSGGLATTTNNHIDNAELTLGWVGPSAAGKVIQTEYHKLINADKPMGWHNQLSDEPGIILSLERQWPQFLAFSTNRNHRIRLTPHIGGSVGNIYTYANAGLTLSFSPNDGSIQDQPLRVRPAMPSGGFFLPGKNKWSWQAFVGFDTRLVARNIFLDGNTFSDSHSVNKRPIVFDATAGIAANYDAFRIGYSVNWRSREFNSPLAKNQVFGAVSLSFRY